MAQLTLFNSDSTLTKSFWSDGRKGSSSFYSGSFEVCDIPTHEDLAHLISSLSHNQALCYSLPFGYEAGTIVTSGNEKPNEGVISRTKNYFDYPDKGGWLFIDCDEDLTEQQVVKRLETLYSPFGQATYVFATSTSNGIGGKKGFHLYFKVKRMAIVKQAMDNLFLRAFNAGYGFCKVSKAGSILNRTFFDGAVYDKARLDFISGPICHDFEAPERDIRVVQREIDEIELEGLLELVDASEAVAQARSEKEAEADGICERFAADKGISLVEYKAIRDGGNLHPGTILLKDDGGEIDVAEVLRISMAAFLSGNEIEPIAIQHPLEGSLEEKTILYFNPESGVPVIHSFAHGGQTWKLKDDGSIISTLSGEEYLLRQLKAAHSSEAVPEGAERLPLHDDTEEVLQMMVKTFTEEYHSERLLLDQWREMISLYLHMLDGHRGRYSIELPPSHGKTQVIRHVILWLYQSKRVVPISLSCFKIDEIDDHKNWLLERLDRQWRDWETADRVEFPYEPADYLKIRHSKERTPFPELDQAPIIIHTHHVVRRNDFKEQFFSFQGEERHLFIFDEAMYKSLLISDDAKDCIRYLRSTVAAGNNGKVKGLPLLWLNDFSKRLLSAFYRLNNWPLVKEVIIEMPKLSERFVNTGYYLNDSDAQNFILKLMNIGAVGERQFIVSREQGGLSLFAFKENDISKLPRVINTDATRSVRKVHEYGNSCVKYPIEPYEGDGKVVYWIAPFKKTGREAVAEDPNLHLRIAKEWLQHIGAKKVIVIASKSTELNLEHLPGLLNPYKPEEIRKIHWGMHKQTNEFQDFDAVIALNYFRKRGYNYKHDIYAERGSTEPLPPNAIREVEHGFIVDELMQGFGRGTMRKGMEQHCLLFSPYSVKESAKLLVLLESNVRQQDAVELFEYDPFSSALDSHYKTDEELKSRERKGRSDRVYESTQEKNWANKFRQYCRTKGFENGDQLQWPYLDAKRADSKVTPSKWLKANVFSDESGCRVKDEHLTKV
ncbi:hypothetical protein [Desulfogranum marinum]|uniref:hypothetical protein n=1 Tax=Desulfogranum marinum TaxID=453220 RepID=UPI001964111E|nr:hypothetical protein [Desulfogranum marinum]MBM9514726.1 hypothetical protein [Desulfogranum marinum]